MNEWNKENRPKKEPIKNTENHSKIPSNMTEMNTEYEGTDR